MIGQTDADLAAQQLQPPEMRAYWQQVAEAISAVLHQGHAEQRIHRMPTAEGLQRYETTYMPLKDAQNQLCQILSISRAIAPSTPTSPPQESSQSTTQPPPPPHPPLLVWVLKCPD